MRIYINRTTGKFITSPTFDSAILRYDFKRGDTHRIEIGFVEDSVLVPLVGSFVITFGLKEAGKYDGDFVVSETDFELNGSTGFFEGTPNFNTIELDDLLNAGDGDDTNDVAFVDCLFEVSVNDDNGIFSSSTSVGRVYHDVVKGDEGVPTTGSPVYPTATEITDHLADVTGNPHAVTAVQVGATPIAHATDTANPHSVTASQVGAVDLTTAQTVAGAKTWTGQLEATAQAATTDDSLITRGLGDLRYLLEDSKRNGTANSTTDWVEIYDGADLGAGSGYAELTIFGAIGSGPTAKGSYTVNMIWDSTGGGTTINNLETSIVDNLDSSGAFTVTAAQVSGELEITVTGATATTRTYYSQFTKFLKT